MTRISFLKLTSSLNYLFSVLKLLEYLAIGASYKQFLNKTLFLEDKESCLGPVYTIPYSYRRVSLRVTSIG